MDYGTVGNIDVVNIKYLHSQFLQIPSQAFRGTLSHIKPIDLHWTPEASECFLSLIRDKVLFAKITEINEEVKYIFNSKHCLLVDHHSSNWYSCIALLLLLLLSLVIEGSYLLYDPM